MEDFLAFRKMITPIIIQILFWIGCVVSVIMGIILIANSHSLGIYGRGSWNAGTILAGIFLIILGPLFVRIWCEILILFFRINETLTEIKNITKEKNP